MLFTIRDSFKTTACSSSLFDFVKCCLELRKKLFHNGHNDLWGEKPPEFKIKTCVPALNMYEKIIAASDVSIIPNRSSNKEF